MAAKACFAAQGMRLTVKMRSAAVEQDSWQAKTAQALQMMKHRRQQPPCHGRCLRLRRRPPHQKQMGQAHRAASTLWAARLPSAQTSSRWRCCRAASGRAWCTLMPSRCASRLMLPPVSAL